VTWSFGDIPLSILSSIWSMDASCLAAAAQDPVYVVSLISHSFSPSPTPMAPPCQVCVRAALQVLCALVLIVLSFTSITVISSSVRLHRGCLDRARQC
jgi:hypothetical protein